MSWNKIKRYAGMSFGRPAVVGGEFYNRKIRNYIKSGYKSTADRRRKSFKPTRTRTIGKRRRTTGRRRFGRGRRMRMKGARNNALYRSALKHTLTQEAIEVDSLGGNIAIMGDNQQAYCQWYAFAMETTPTGWDRMLASSSQVAIGSVKSTAELFFDNCKNQVDFRNNSTHTAKMQVYKCTPRIDIPAANVVYGANPAMFVAGFTGVAQESKSSAGLVYNEYNATPYMSANWCSAFKIKPLFSKRLEPGQGATIKHSRKLGYIVKKSSYLIDPASSFAATYSHTRKNGPIYLVKMVGDIVHNQASVAYPLVTGTSLSTTTGGFNVDFVFKTRLSYRSPYIGTTRVQGVYNRLAQNITRANEDQFTENVPNEVAIAA